jgi:hypothetical protein
VGERTEAELLAEIERLARELRELALARDEHGLAVTAGVIADHAGVGAWGLGAVLSSDGFRA